MSIKCASNFRPSRWNETRNPKFFLFFFIRHCICSLHSFVLSEIFFPSDSFFYLFFVFYYQTFQRMTIENGWLGNLNPSRDPLTDTHAKAFICMTINVWSQWAPHPRSPSSKIVRRHHDDEQFILFNVSIVSNGNCKKKRTSFHSSSLDGLT